jgi:hypothetical protein
MIQTTIFSREALLLLARGVQHQEMSRWHQMREGAGPASGKGKLTTVTLKACSMTTILTWQQGRMRKKEGKKMLKSGGRRRRRRRQMEWKR